MKHSVFTRSCRPGTGLGIASWSMRQERRGPTQRGKNNAIIRYGEECVGCVAQVRRSNGSSTHACAADYLADPGAARHRSLYLRHAFATTFAMAAKFGVPRPVDASQPLIAAQPSVLPPMALVPCVTSLNMPGFW